MNSAAHKRRKPFSEESRKKISEGRKRYLASHPEEVRYVKYHYSKARSYPEQYFYDWLVKEGIEFEEQFHVGTYVLDFKIRKY